MVHVPAVLRTTLPSEDRAHAAEVLEKVTALLDPPPVALTMKLASVAILLASVPNVMLCGALFTVKVCSWSVAALYRASPAWLAVTVQVPAPVAVTVVPLTLQGPK